jgi:succinoglycan biosynthesis transport protein ExoP
MSTPSVAYDSPQESLFWNYVDALRRRRTFVLAVFAVVSTVAILRTLLLTPVYEATAQILIERDTPQVLTFKEVAEVDAARDDYYQTQYKLLQNRILIGRVIDSLGLLQDPEFGGPLTPDQLQTINAAGPGVSPAIERAVGVFLGKLRVQPIRNSRLVAVTFESGRPERAAEVANRLAQLYIQQSLEMRYQTSAEAAQWLGTQIEDQRKKAEAAGRALQKVKETEGIVNLEERRTLLEQKLKELGTALTTLKTTRLEREALYNQMRRARNPEELPEVMRSPLVQSLRIELANLERQQAQLLERYLDEHPEVVKVRTQIGETRRKISAESERVIRAAENDYKAAAAQEGSVAAALEATKAETLDLSRRAINYDSQKREMDAANGVLDSLLSRHKQTDVAQELKSSNIRIVDPAAVPRKPVRPRPLRDIPLALALGLLAGVGLALLVEQLDNRLRTPEEVRVQLGTPLLAIIPETPESMAVGDLPRLGQGPFADGVRVLRTALAYSWADRKSRVVVVTSTTPGEGKTVVSVHLALSLASAGDEVLLVDADLRKPQAHELLRARRRPGLSDAFTGRAKVSETIRSLGVARLSFLPAGSSVPSPADLLAVDAMPKLLEGLRGFYRWIVIDTPPVGAVPDALLLAPPADGVVVVAAADRVRRGAVRLTLSRLAETGARVLGVVLNRAVIEKHSYYYGQQYPYGYGRDDSRVEKGPRPVVATFGSRKANP